MAPATDFFRSPEALRGVVASVAVWASESDEIMRPDGARLLVNALREVVPVEFRVVAGAGHFVFMDDPPPHVTGGAMPEELRREVVSFATGPRGTP